MSGRAWDEMTEEEIDEQWRRIFGAQQSLQATVIFGVCRWFSPKGLELASQAHTLMTRAMDLELRARNRRAERLNAAMLEQRAVSKGAGAEAL